MSIQRFIWNEKNVFTVTFNISLLISFQILLDIFLKIFCGYLMKDLKKHLSYSQKKN